MLSIHWFPGFTNISVTFQILLLLLLYFIVFFNISVSALVSFFLFLVVFKLLKCKKLVQISSSSPVILFFFFLLCCNYQLHWLPLPCDSPVLSHVKLYLMDWGRPGSIDFIWMLKAWQLHTWLNFLISVSFSCLCFLSPQDEITELLPAKLQGVRRAGMCSWSLSSLKVSSIWLL